MKHLALLLVLSVAVSGCVKDKGTVACTLEAKLCPDGSAVGRMGPDCGFAPCPAQPAPNLTDDGGCVCPSGYRQEGESCNPGCYYSNPPCMAPSIPCEYGGTPHSKE